MSLDNEEGDKKRRRRVKTKTFDFDDVDNEEQRMIQQALRNSQVETSRAHVEIPTAPTFYPTVQEFKNPLQYINSIRAEAEQWGICKIVPPAEWMPPNMVDFNDPFKFPTKLQEVNSMQEGLGFPSGRDFTIREYHDMAKRFYNNWVTTHYAGESVMDQFPLEFDNSTGAAGGPGVRAGAGAAKIKAESPEAARARLEITPEVKLRYERLAKDYWDMVEMGSGSVSKRATVEYANDLDTTKFCSGFPLSASARKMYRSFESKPPTAEEVVAAVAKAAAKAADKPSSAVKEEELEGVGTEPPDCADMFSDDYYRRTGWNLVNIARCEGSVLSHLKTNINGINVPWLYIGMLFSSFCWHNEDNYLYSINYSHFGEAKQWYGVPGVHAKNFEKVTKNFLMESFKASPDLLHHMTTQISPSLLVSNGIPVSKIVQTPRTFVVTFPKSFHAGFSYGFNCGEAVNFATPDWLNEGTQADERYRSFGRSSVFSHQRLLFTLLQHNSAEMAAERRANFRKKESFISLLLEVKSCLTEDLNARPWLVSQGVRDISQYVKLPGNNFDEIDERSSNYDDLRSCCQCKHICLLTAVACECDKNKVSCIRHSLQACRCPKEKRYMLQWMSTDDMHRMLRQVEKMIATAEKGGGSAFGK